MSEYTAIILGLPWSMDNEILAGEFSACGEVSDARIVLDKNTHRSRGFGFVTFADENGLTKCLERNGETFEGRVLKIEKAKERPATNVNPKKVFDDTNKVIVNRLSMDTTTDSLRSAMSKFGNVIDCQVLVDRQTGNSRGCGVVRFETEEDMNKAISSMNETEFEGREVTVSKFVPKSGPNKNRNVKRFDDDEKKEKENKKQKY